MKLNIKKSSLVARIATAVILLAGSGIGAYLLIPAKKISVNQDINNGGGFDENSYFGQFVTKLTSILDEDSEESIPGMQADFEDFEITWPSKSGLSMNDIKVDGLLALNMNGLDNINLTVDLEADYNSKKLDLGIGLVDRTLYFSLQDLNIKCSNSTIEDLTRTIHDLFFNPDNENGLGIDLDINQFLNSIIDTVIGGLDIGAISLDGLDVNETVQGNDVLVELGIGGIVIKITMDKEALTLKCVDLGTINVGEATIKGKLNFTVSDEIKIYGLDDPLYQGKQRGEFYEVIGYIGWAERLLNLLQTRKLGLNLNASLYKANKSSRIVDVKSDINLDVSELIDFSNINVNEMIESGNEEVEEEDESTGLDKLLDGIKLSAFFDVKGAKDEDYANLILSYIERTGYLTLNEKNDDSAVMRAKIDVETVSDIIKKVPDLLATLTPEENTNSEVEDDAEGLFDFVTSSELVTAIKDGMYDGILDVIKSIKNTASTIEIELSLKTLNFGNQSIIKLILDASSSAIESGSKVLYLGAENIELGNLVLDLELSTDAFSSTELDKTISMKDKFDDLHFVTDIFDQVTHILDVQKAYVDLEGKILDDAGLGFTFDGWAQFDYREKYGYGNATFYEYKKDPTSYCAEHSVDIDVNGKAASDDDKNMLFEYREKLKGKFTIQTLNDIIDLVKELIAANDPRFTKFLEPIKEMLLVGVIGEAINNEDYVAIAKPTVIKKIAQSNDGMTLNIIIGKEALLLDSDIALAVNFAKDFEGKKSINSLEISGIKLGEKNIYLKVKLGDFKENLSSPVNKSNMAAFYDFSDIAVLLKFGINSTQLNVYHLTAPLSVGISGFDALKINLNFYIVVDGVSTKVYGRIPKVPWLTDIASQNLLSAANVSSEFVFEPSHQASGNDIGGYFHIIKHYDYPSYVFTSDKSYYYKSDSKFFLENIVDYLLIDMLDFRASLFNNISLDLGGVDDSNYEDLFRENGFVYTDNGDGSHVWDVKLNLQALTGSSSLGDLDLVLTGVDVNGVGYFNTANISMKVLGGLVTVKGTITLDNPNPDTVTWPTAVEQSYNRITGIYNNMSETDQRSFDANYLNKPSTPYTKMGFLKPITL